MLGGDLLLIQEERKDLNATTSLAVRNDEVVYSLAVIDDEVVVSLAVWRRRWWWATKKKPKQLTLYYNFIKLIIKNNYHIPSDGRRIKRDFVDVDLGRD